jgi:hypothetical protein
MAQGNRHPVDRLGDIRERRKELDNEEAEVRPVILRLDGRELAGDDWMAEIRTMNRMSPKYDMRAIEQHFGRAALERFRTGATPKTVRQIFLMRRADRARQGLKMAGK